MNLYGLDQAIQDAYTVSDNAGNKWQLLTTQNISAAGTYVFLFKSAVAGAVYSVPNTITVPVTIVLGVSAINNPTTFTTLGINEESDNALKIRRQKSVALSSQGFHDALLAALENITGVSSAFVYENLSGSTNSDGVPGHSLWVIVSGTAAAADIANAIYTKRNAGCGMYGDVSYIITQKDLSPFIVSWDVVTPQNLFIKFTATSLDGINAPAIASIVTGLPSIEVPGVHAQVNINDLATQVQKIDPNTLVTNAGFSLSAAGPYYPSLVPTSKKNQFAVSAANIIALPMILSPAIYSIGRGGLTKTFVAQGGYGPNTFDISSGIGAVDATTGVYTSPAGAGSAIVRVTDSLGNTATSMVTIT